LAWMEVGLECGGVGQQIAFRGDAWRDECQGGVSIVGHGRCPCEGGQPRSTLHAHPRCSTDAAACPPARPCGCPGCMPRCWQSPTDMQSFVVGANAEKAPGRSMPMHCVPWTPPHVITVLDARGKAAGSARRNLEGSSKHPAVRPVGEPAPPWRSGAGREPGRRKTWHLFIVRLRLGLRFGSVFGVRSGIRTKRQPLSSVRLVYRGRALKIECCKNYQYSKMVGMWTLRAW